MFALGRLFARRGLRVLAATTTMISDPETVSEREGRLFGKVVTLEYPASREGREILRREGCPLVLGSRREGEKLCGVEPASIDAVADLFDIVIVEADGSRGLPVKAPAPHEPVVPASSAVVIGVVGLDALGMPMDESVVHRPELFGPLVGCSPGEAITAVHLARLAASPAGLFKGVPANAMRVVLLNKADLVGPGLAANCRDAILATGRVDEALLGAIGASAERATQ